MSDIKVVDIEQRSENTAIDIAASIVAQRVLTGDYLIDQCMQDLEDRVGARMKMLMGDNK